MRDLDAVSRLAATVDGWLSDAQGRALHEAAAATTGRGAIVEIGSWKGRSTVWLGLGAQRAGQKVYAVDPHANAREDPTAKTLDTFRSNLARAGLSETVETLVMTSTQAERIVPGDVELLFVDGDHSVEGSRRDAELWLPRVGERGVVMFHDVATSGYEGPRRVFQRRICWDRRYCKVRRVGSMGIAERTSRRSAGDALRSTCFGLLLYLYDLEGAVKRRLRRARRIIGFHSGSASPN
jgi:MMP 1-O-methyltransferase